MMRHSVRQSGYTLLEMAIVLAIMSAIAGSVLTLGSAKHEASKIDITKKRLDAIEEAIKRHSYTAGFIPCPADPTTLPGDATYGISQDCGGTIPAGIDSAGVASDEVWIGAIPTRSLNLPDSVMYDGWQNRFTYVAVADLAINSSGFSSYTTSSTSGVIQIVDNDGTQVTDPTTDTVVAYAVISHGKDKKGAITRNGIMPIICGATTKDDENCDADAVFRDSRILDSNVAANYYDDLIRWKVRHFMQPPAGDANLYNSSCTTESLGGGADISCVLNGDGTPYCWGGQNQGQFGNGTTNLSNPSPIPAYTAAPGGNSGYKMIEVDTTNGTSCTCIINASNQIWCAGRNNSGQLGTGAAGADQSTPVQEATLASNWSKLVVEQNHVCAINTLGELYCWGQNIDGRIGDGTTSPNRPSPTRVGAASDWTALGATNLNSCGLRGSGVAYCWGANGAGQTGNGNFVTPQPTPQLVLGGITDWTMVKGNNSHVCGLRSTGQAYCWGNGTGGRLGTGATSSVNTPTQIPGNFTDWTYIVGGHESTCGIRGGRMYCVGSRINYGIPDGGAVGGGDQLTLVEAAGGITDWAMVSAPANRGGCAARANGRIYCWGLNNTGQVGNNALGVPTTTPTLVTGLNGCN